MQQPLSFKTMSPSKRPQAARNRLNVCAAFKLAMFPNINDITSSHATISKKPQGIKTHHLHSITAIFT